MPIWQGDALEELQLLPAECVQCSVTSPPYWGLRDYGVAGQLGLEKTPDEYVERLVEVFREVGRVLRKDGTLWLNLGDSYNNFRTQMGPGQAVHGREKLNGKPAVNSKERGWNGLKEKDLVGIPWRVAFALQADGWYLRSDIIWAKPNPMPESVRDRPTRSHEYLFLLTKSERYWYDAGAIKEPTAYDPDRPRGGRETKRTDAERAQWDFKDYHEGRTMRMNGRQADPFTRNRRTVWTITPQPFKGAHFAVFPEKLVEPCILAGSRPGDLVLDPFCGSGTVGVVAKLHGREFIGIDLNAAYCQMARDRIGR